MIDEASWSWRLLCDLIFLPLSTYDNLFTCMIWCADHFFTWQTVTLFQILYRPTDPWTCGIRELEKQFSCWVCITQQTTSWELRGRVQHTEDADNDSPIENQNYESWAGHKNSHASPNKRGKSDAAPMIFSRVSVGEPTREPANAQLHDMEIMRGHLRRHAKNADRRSASGALRARADANSSMKVSVSITLATVSLDDNNDRLTSTFLQELLISRLLVVWSSCEGCSIHNCDVGCGTRQKPHPTVF